MNVDEVRKYCLAFPGATEKLQWDDALCFKVSEKMFAVLGLDRVRLTFKCAPQTFAELIEREDIHPSPYLGRHNWVMLDRLDAIGWRELQLLIRESFEMIATKASKKTRKSSGGESVAGKKVKVRPGSKSKTRSRPGKRS
jgi:predicted DNA-binding protein (MmcQ/YjbR family)